MRPFETLLEEAVVFHGHMCPGQVLGVRMVLAGCLALGIDEPRAAGKSLAVFVEINRCAADAIQSVTGCSLGRRNLWHVDYGKMAATFVNVPMEDAVRVVARDDARAAVPRYVDDVADMRRAQIAGYRLMPDDELLVTERVAIRPGWLDRRRARVPCRSCGEGINYEREIVRAGTVFCRACAGFAYYMPLGVARVPAESVGAAGGSGG
jgi:formylmethanofuran dehydrogenase subunit E